MCRRLLVLMVDGDGGVLINVEFAIETLIHTICCELSLELT